MKRVKSYFNILITKDNKKGFTLVELLATIVILGIIMAIVAVSIIGNMKKSKQTAFANVSEIILKYVEDNYNACKLYKDSKMYDTSVFDEKCELIIDKEELSKNLIIKTGHSLEDIEKVEVSVNDKGEFGIVVIPKEGGKFSDVDNYSKGIYKSTCWTLEEITKTEYKLIKFHGIKDDGIINSSCTQYVSKDNEGYYSVNIPGEVDSKKITTLGNNLFNAIESLVFEINLDFDKEILVVDYKLDTDDFYSKIKSINIENSIKKIEDWDTKNSNDLILFNELIGKSVVELFENYEAGNNYKKEGYYYSDGIGSFAGIGLKDCNIDLFDSGNYPESYGNIMINLPNSLEKIGHGAFYWSSLMELKISNNVIVIGDYAFFKNQIKSLTIEGTEDGTSKLKTIGENAFYQNKLTSALIIPKNVETIQEKAFFKNQIQSLIIPNTVKYIGNSAFDNNKISSLIFEGAEDGTSQLKTIGENAFYHNFIKSIILPNSIEYLSGFNGNQISSLTIPSFVKEIGDSAFASNQISSLTIKGAEDGTSRLKKIGKDAFYGNNLVSNLIIPNTVEEIGDSAFFGNQLSSLTIKGAEDGTSRLKKIGKDAFDGNNLVSNLIIPNTVEEIGDYAFSMNQLSSLTIKGAEDGTSNLKKIGKEAFGGNDIILDLIIPNTVEEIGVSPFRKNKISSLTIKGAEDGTSRLKKIGENAFFNTNLVSNIIIPNTVEEIGDSAFSGNQLSSLTIKGAEDGTSRLKKIGKDAFYGNNLVSNIIIPNTVEEIGDSAFSGNQLSSLTIKGAEDGTSRLKKIGDSAFSDSKITGELIIPSSIEYLSGFEGNDIQSLVIKRGLNGISKLKTIGDWAFSLNQITGELIIPNSVETIGYAAFEYTDIVKLTFENNSNLKKIDTWAFYGCHYLNYPDEENYLYLPSTLKEVGTRVFYNTNSLNFIKYSGDTSTFGEQWNGTATVIK